MGIINDPANDRQLGGLLAQYVGFLYTGFGLCTAMLLRTIVLSYAELGFKLQAPCEI